MRFPNSFLLIVALAFLLLSFARSDEESSLSSSSQRNDVCPSLSDGSSGSGCPIRCFRPDPVCGDDGVTYWCGCPDAACAGVHVAKRGPCQVGNGGSAPVSAQAFLLIHIVWLIVLGFSVLCGFL